MPILTSNPTYRYYMQRIADLREHLEELQAIFHNLDNRIAILRQFVGGDQR